MSKLVAAVFGSVLVALVVVVLVKADAALFEQDAEFSKLYDTTLRDAYSRFAASDRKVPAGGDPADEFGAGAAGAAPAQAAGAVMPPSAAGRSAAPGAHNLGFGKGPQAPAAAPGTVGQPVAAAPHIHPPPDDGGPHTQRAQELMGQGKYDEAVAEFRLALQEKPERITQQHSMGDAQRYAGKHAEAIASYQVVLQAKPTFYCCYFHMGEILAAQGQQQQAEAYFTQGVEGYRKDIAAGGPQANVAAYQLAKFYADNKRNPSECVTLAEQAVAAAPNQPAYLHLLARCYELAGRREDALKTMDQVLNADPQNAQIYQAYRQQLLNSPGSAGSSGGAAAGGPRP